MAKLIKTLIVDDEDNVREVMRKLLNEYCENVSVVAEANSVKSGINAIKKYNPDLVLLDIKMGDGTGFDLIDNIETINFKVIFVTAFEEYAVKAFKFSALDYILKPVDPDELIEAVKRTEEVMQHEMQLQLSAFSSNMENTDVPRKKLVLKTLDNIFLVKLEDITYCESDGAYTKFHSFDQKEIMVSRSLKEYQEMLSDQGFFRVHKSFLINLSHILRFEKTDGGFVVLTNEDRVPVSSRKKDQLMSLFEKLSN
jgi:two-component system, LytTR family, response regulator